MNMERDIWYEVERRLGRPPSVTDEQIVKAVIEGIKLDADKRAIHTLVTASGTGMRYMEDATFHAAVTIIARTVVAGVFGDIPLTPEERRLREASIEELMRKLA
jgi:hypothetical protein